MVLSLYIRYTSCFQRCSALIVQQGQYAPGSYCTPSLDVLIITGGRSATWSDSLYWRAHTALVSSKSVVADILLTVVQGMIWHMDPFLMPYSFCLAQITLMNYSTFLLTGVCACFTYATAIAVIFPDTSPHSSVYRSSNGG